VLDGRAERVSDGGVEAPKTAQPVVFHDFQKAWSANSGLFHFFGVPISSNIDGLVDLPSRLATFPAPDFGDRGLKILQAIVSHGPSWTDLKGLVGLSRMDHGRQRSGVSRNTISACLLRFPRLVWESDSLTCWSTIPS
jgi:hypothetical protein